MSPVLRRRGHGFLAMPGFRWSLTVACAFGISLAAAAPTPAQANDTSGPPATRALSAEKTDDAYVAAIRDAFALLKAGQTEERFKQLRAALIDLARTDRYGLTIASYAEAGSTLHEAGLDEQAAQIFSEGAQTEASRADVRETADFYLAYARFRTDVPDEKQHFVPLYSAATNLYAKYYGRESPQLIDANDRLGQALLKIGQYGTALNLEQGNYDLVLKVSGADDPLTWRVGDNLATLLREMGSPSRALTYDRDILAARTKRYGRNHFNVMLSANNVALDQLQLEDYPAALANFETCLEIAKALADTGNQPVMERWIEYTKLVSGSAALDDASIARMDALITDGDYPAILSIAAANLLADHFLKSGDPDRAMRHLDQAYRIAGSEMSTAHPLTFAGRIAMANAKASTRIAEAAADFASIDKDLLDWVYLQVAYAGSRDLADATRAMADDMLYDYARIAERDPDAVAAFADAARRWPALDTGPRDDRRKLLRLIDPADTETAGILRRSLRLSYAMQEIFAGGTENDLGYTLVDENRELDQRLQQRLDGKYKFTASTLEKPLPTAAELLGDKQALVQYFITRKWRPDRTAADPFVDTRLYSIVSRKGRAPRLFDLGDPRTLTASANVEQIASLRSTRSGEDRGAVPLAAVTQTFTGIYGRLIAPLDSELADVDTVLIVPDGNLYAVPFSLLRDQAGRLLEDRFTVRLLTRPNSLYGIDARQTLTPGKAVLVGGLDYANGGEKGAQPLPDTLKEVDDVSAILKGDGFRVESLTGEAATERTLKEEVEKASIAHLATHGAYRSARNGGAADVDTLWQSEVILSKSGDRHEMKRDDRDGRLYAFELMNWNLSNLDLLVLSACETGRGEETFVGGLRGMPTAIDIAGARRSLLTLWPVDDEGTAQFMTRYYKHLVGGMTFADALRRTRQDAIRGDLPAAKNPLVWAAFVLFEN